MKRGKSNIVRSTRVWFTDLNSGKQQQLKQTIVRGADIQRFYVDQAWQEQRFDGRMPTLDKIHRGRDRFQALVRLVQPMAKQASEMVASQRKVQCRKPQVRKNTITLYYHHVNVERAENLKHFDWVLTLKGAGVPTLELPFHGHAHFNELLGKGYGLQRTVRFGIRNGQVYADLILRKDLEGKVGRPRKKRIVGLDLNLKAGAVLSDGQTASMSGMPPRPGASKQQRRAAHQLSREAANRAVKSIDLSQIDTIVLEELRHIKHGKRGTLPRSLTSRLSHWHYRHFVTRLQQRCEAEGVDVTFVNPAYTSQFCRSCNRWDSRNRKGDVFACVNCGHTDHADMNAAHNIVLLGSAGVYGLRELPNLDSAHICAASI